METEVSLIIVLYKPKPEDCQHVKLLASIYGGCIADNSPEPVFEGDKVGKMTYLWMQGNKGIAAAQNRAFEQLDGDTPYVVFLDQDSRVGEDYPLTITSALKSLETKGIGILGPTLVNVENGEAYVHSLGANAGEGYACARELISSGVCIRCDVFRKIGMNDDRLFIDYVDFDMCWRASAAGYQSAVSTMITIRHKVGNRCIAIGPYRDIISSSNRYFYQYRNMLWLLRRNYVPRMWKVKTTIKSFIRLAYLPFVGLSASACALKGIKAGLSAPSNKTA